MPISQTNALNPTQLPFSAHSGQQPLSDEALRLLLLRMAQMMDSYPAQMSSGGGPGGMMSGSSAPAFGGGHSNGGGGGFDLGGALPGSSGFLGGNGGSSGSLGGNSGHTSSYRSTDSYVPSGSDKTGTGMSLSGSAQGHAAVDWARSQLGVSESKNPGTVRGYSNGNWQAWCADFVSKSFSKTGGSPFGHKSSVAGILAWGKKNDRFTSAKEMAKDPSKLQAGDIATWKSNGKSHVGLVTSVNKNGTFNTIEGNTGDKVAERTHGFGKGLTGFVRATKDAPKSSKGSKTSSSAKSSGASKSASSAKSSSKSSGGSKSSSSGGGSKSSKS